MRLLYVAAGLSVILAGAPAFAQTPAPAQPAAPAPAPEKPMTQPAPAAQPPRPFPEGSKYAFIIIQRIANESGEGRASTTKVKALNDRKVSELNEKNKTLQANQQKLAQSGTVMNENARGLLEKEIERQQVEIQRFTQDAQADVQELQQNLQIEFQKKLMPIIQQVAVEKGLHVLFSREDAGIVWADSGLDVTADIIKRFDATAGTAPTAKPSTPPATKPPVN